MKGIQVKLAALLVVAIVAVVAFATTVTVVLIRPPEPNGYVLPLIRGIELVLEADRINGPLAPVEKAGMAIVSQPPTGRSTGFQNGELTAILKQAGVADESLRVQSASGRSALVVPLRGERWLMVDLAYVPDFDRALSLVFAWATMIVLGAISIALFAARRITAPATQIDAAIASVGQNGILPFVEPKGSVSERQTAMMLNTLGERLKTAVASRMRLVAAAGHDLRTPLTRLLLRVEFLPEEERQAWRSDLEELGQIADSAIRLVHEETRGDQEQESVELSGLIAEIAAELQQSGLRIAVGSVVRAQVLVGRLALKRALRNLLVNAATHGGSARVSLAPQQESVAIIIDDEGPGIPPQLLEQAFEPFFRVEAGRTKRVPGAGLGLAIAREIIERFGGKIMLENRHTGGLQQTIRLPRVHSLTTSKQSR